MSVLQQMCWDLWCLVKETSSVAGIRGLSQFSASYPGQPGIISSDDYFILPVQAIFVAFCWTICSCKIYKFFVIGGALVAFQIKQYCIYISTPDSHTKARSQCLLSLTWEFSRALGGCFGARLRSLWVSPLVCVSGEGGFFISTVYLFGGKLCFRILQQSTAVVHTTLLTLLTCNWKSSTDSDS